MIKNYKKAFTLAEIMLAAMVMIVVMALVAPNLSRLMPDSDAIRFKKVYNSIVTVVDSMSADARVYPDFSGFADVSAGTDIHGTVYEGDMKFANFFISKLNVLDDNYQVNGAFPYGVVYDTEYEEVEYERDGEDRVGVRENVEEGVRIAQNFPCVQVNTGEIFCLPPSVDTLDPRDPNSENTIYIRIYMQDENFSEQNAFYVAVRANGKVSLPTSGMSFNCKTADDTGRMRDRTFNQCRAVSFLDSI